MQWRVVVLASAIGFPMTLTLGCSMLREPAQAAGRTLSAPNIAFNARRLADGYSVSPKHSDFQWQTTSEKKSLLYPQLVTNDVAWLKICNSLSVPEPPEIDFRRSFAYLFAMDANNPNQIGVEFSVDRDGVLDVKEITTFMGFPRSDVLNVSVILIPRGRITAFRGRFTPDAQTEVIAITTNLSGK